jgi:6-phosphogluconolactonase
MSNPLSGAVFVQTNDAETNAVVGFARADDGSLSDLGTFATGGRGNGTPHLPSQGSLVATGDGTRLLVANAGSDDISVFAVSADGLALADRVASGGSVPRSVAAHGDLVYVLNTGGDGAGSVNGFRLQSDGRLTPIAGSERPLSADESDGAQVAFDPSGRTLVVTERVTDRVTTYAVGMDGLLEGPTGHPSSGATPYGFDFSADGVLVVTEAFGGQVGAAAASSYRVSGDSAAEPVSASIGNTRSEVCWAVVTKDGRHAFVTNFGDGTISSYSISAEGSIELLEAVAATTRLGEKGIRDAALSADGSFLYALDADSQEIYAWIVGDEGSLAPVGATNGLPTTVAGLAAL